MSGVEDCDYLETNVMTHISYGQKNGSKQLESPLS